MDLLVTERLHPGGLSRTPSLAGVGFSLLKTGVAQQAPLDLALGALGGGAGPDLGPDPPPPSVGPLLPPVCTPGSPGGPGPERGGPSSLRPSGCPPGDADGGGAGRVLPPVGAADPTLSRTVFSPDDGGFPSPATVTAPTPASQEEPRCPAAAASQEGPRDPKTLSHLPRETGGQAPEDEASTSAEQRRLFIFTQRYILRT